MSAHLRKRGVIRKSILVHDPVRLPSLWSPPLVEHERLPEAHNRPPVIRRAENPTIRPSGFPESLLGGPVRPATSPDLLVPRHEEVPLPLAIPSQT